jgi:hypothetical protein
MPAPLIGLAVGVLIQLAEKAMETPPDQRTPEQRHLADLAEEESFKRLAEATGHGAGTEPNQ